jgi:hypothetical protein
MGRVMMNLGFDIRGFNPESDATAEKAARDVLAREWQRRAGDAPYVEVREVKAAKLAAGRTEDVLSVTWASLDG